MSWVKITQIASRRDAQVLTSCKPVRMAEYLTARFPHRPVTSRGLSYGAITAVDGDDCDGRDGPTKT